MEQIPIPTDWWDTAEQDRGEGGGPDRGKHSKKLQYMNQVINMQRWMIKKSLKLYGI